VSLLSAAAGLRNESSSPSRSDRSIQIAAARQTNGPISEPRAGSPQTKVVPAAVPSIQLRENRQSVTPVLPAPQSLPAREKLSFVEQPPSPALDHPPPATPSEPEGPFAPPPASPPEASQPAVADLPAKEAAPEIRPQPARGIAVGETASSGLASRLVGLWTYSAGSVYSGVQPEIAEMAIRNDNGYLIGALTVRFKSASKDGGDSRREINSKAENQPWLRFTFSGDLGNAPRTTFSLETKDGGEGTIELIPGAAPNLLQVIFQTQQEHGKTHSGDMILTKRVTSTDREHPEKTQLPLNAPSPEANPPPQVAPPPQSALERQLSPAGVLSAPPLLSRLIGSWSYPATRDNGPDPELFEMAIRNDNLYVIGTLWVRFKSPSTGVSEPVLRLAFSGDLPNAPRPTFKLETREGGQGTIELIPGTAPNLLEVKFQAQSDRQSHSGNIVLVKRDPQSRQSISR
jgi:hypothetical protein